MRSFVGWIYGATRIIVATCAAVSTQRIKRLLYRRIFGWSIHDTARIGFSFILVEQLVLKERGKISHGNVIKGCQLVELQVGSGIGALNWISAPPSASKIYTHERQSRLLLDCGAQITSRHLIDCTETVRLGKFAVLAGNRSQILTHEPDIRDRKVRTDPVTIGDHSVVFTSVTLLAGAVVPGRSVVGAGAVVGRGLKEELWLYGGVPARPIKVLPAESLQFNRKS